MSTEVSNVTEFPEIIVCTVLPSIVASADDTMSSVVRFTVIRRLSFAKAAELLLSILRETNFGGTVSALSNPTKVGIEIADKLFPAKS